MKLEKLKEWGQNRVFKKSAIDLNRGEKVINREKLFKSHIIVLEANKGKKRFKCYYDRLLRLYQLIIEEEKGE